MTKYSIEEIDAMRRAVDTLCDNGNSYNPDIRGKEVEERLRTYMQNGTTPAELASAANKHSDALYKQQEVRQKIWEDAARRAPPPRVLKTKEDVIDEWFQTCVAKYSDASVTSKELFDGFGGKTLMSFANRSAPDGVNITRRDMEKYLDRKGVKSRSAMFEKRYDGIRHIIHGDVRSGNFGT